MKHFAFFSHTKSSKISVHFLFTAHLHWDWPHFKCSMALCGYWLSYWGWLPLLSQPGLAGSPHAREGWCVCSWGSREKSGLGAVHSSFLSYLSHCLCRVPKLLFPLTVPNSWSQQSQPKHCDSVLSLILESSSLCLTSVCPTAVLNPSCNPFSWVSPPIQLHLRDFGVGGETHEKAEVHGAVADGKKERLEKPEVLKRGEEGVEGGGGLGSNHRIKAGFLESDFSVRWSSYPLRFLISSASQISWAHLDCPPIFTPSLISLTPQPLITSSWLLYLSVNFSALHLFSSLPAPTNLSLHFQPSMLGPGEIQSGDLERGVEVYRPELAASPVERRKTLPVPSHPLYPSSRTPPPWGCSDSTVSGLEGLGAPC